MHTRIFISLLLCFSFQFLFAQKELAYRSHLKDFRSKYVRDHEVVGKKDKKFFRFFETDPAMRVKTNFQKIPDSSGISMPTSSGKSKRFFTYGKISFRIGDGEYQLYIYQSEKLMEEEKTRDYLFIPFTDLTSGRESYGGGRYIDLSVGDLETNDFYLDFNKAYNPYCAYASGFNCPIPPRQNYLDVAIKAGERAFGKHH